MLNTIRRARYAYFLAQIVEKMLHSMKSDKKGGNVNLASELYFYSVGRLSSIQIGSPEQSRGALIEILH
jgi:hypothetical protein